MKLVCTGILLVMLAVCVMTVSAEEAGNESEIEMVEMTEETAGDEVAVDSSRLFGRVHATLLMATEDAFGYLLNGNELEKKSYYDRIALSEEAMAQFEQVAQTIPENETALVAGYEKVMDQYGKMTDAADAMFTSFETEGKPVIEDVVAFEEVVDSVFNATEEAWNAHHPESDIPQTADSSERMLYSRLFSAIEESYAYPILGDVVEKDDALADFASFDESVALVEEAYPDKSFDGLKDVKEEVMQAAERMFATYEKDGAVNATEVEALEFIVLSVQEAYLALTA